MERPIPKAFAACLTCSLCLCTMVAQANLVQNGDFSLPNDVPPYALPDYWLATATALPADGFSGIARTDSADFERCMYFGIGDACPGGTTLTLEQKVSLVPGEYRLCFNFTFNTNGGQGVYESDAFRVLLNGSKEMVVTDHGEAAGFGVDFVDQTAPYCLTFVLGHPEPEFNLGFQLDRDRLMPDVTTIVTLDNVDLSAVAVPVPGAAVLGAIGLSIAGWRLKRRTP
jgi:hypothetical protein